MRAIIEGQVVKVSSEAWEFNGRTGIAHCYFVRDVSFPESSAQRVKTERQDQLPKDGDTVRAAVNVFAQENDRGGAKLRVTHIEFVQAEPARRIHAAG